MPLEAPSTVASSSVTVAVIEGEELPADPPPYSSGPSSDVGRRMGKDCMGAHRPTQVDRAGLCGVFEGFWRLEMIRCLFLRPSLSMFSSSVFKAIH